MPPTLPPPPNEWARIADQEFVLVVDKKLKRPAGMYIQIAYLEPDQQQDALNILELFHPETIVHRVTDEMEIMRGTRAQWQQLADQRRREI